MKKTRCPICEADMPGNRHDYPDYPFCSRRCRIIDLGRWLGEDYRIPESPGSGLPQAARDDDETGAR